MVEHILKVLWGSRDDIEGIRSESRALIGVGPGLSAETPGGIKLPPVGDETGKELANLYMRGVKEGYDAEFVEESAQALLDLLDVFGEDGVRTYLLGVLEGHEDAREDEADAEAAANPNAQLYLIDYETGEATPVEVGDPDEDELLDDEEPEGEPNPN